MECVGIVEKEKERDAAMEDLEKLRRELERSGKAGGLQDLARSPEGQKLKGMVDAQALRKAAQSGDSQALAKLLGGILETPEGRSLAESVRKLMGK